MLKFETATSWIGKMKELLKLSVSLFLLFLGNNLADTKLVCLDPCTPQDCADIYAQGYETNGVYLIYPTGPLAPVPVYCDMSTDGGKWMVFQKRCDGSVDFYRDWYNYKVGFGNADGECWLGLENLFRLTQKRKYELRVDMEDFKKNTAFAKYSSFSISTNAINGETDGYKLYVSGFTDGGAGDCLSIHNGNNFSTFDHDQDVYSGNCAEQFSGAFWYISCHCTNPNGLYLRGNHTSYANGVNWSRWRGYEYSVKSIEFKMRPVN
ncbi:microfibril-associated glycoprotein 4 isoform X2 [Microcaecilia unicolor]|uniref:Microfibril-associated glycoprotein 4-like isoform X2 n=1 Tax=Microcaecilia unicolor TaxID=1415580 RepID=A0A6P7YQA5_9AMPH|nr:microfibril-associated glycoprotein 4-like isoform X2 [Microcaecilia unicolor]